VTLALTTTLWRRIVGLLLLGAFASGSAAFAAEPADAPNELQKAALALKAKRYDEAIQRLQRVVNTGGPEARLRAQSGLGLAYGEVGMLTASIYWWQRFLQATHRDQPRWHAARQLGGQTLDAHRKALNRSHGRVVVNTVPKRATVSVTPAPTWLPPTGSEYMLLAGDYEFVVSAPGHLPSRHTVTVSAAGQARVNVALAKVPPVADKPKNQRPKREPVSPLLIGGAAVTGVGVAAWVVAATFTGLSASDHGELVALSAKGAVSSSELARFERLASRLEARGDVALGFYVAGGVMVAAGSALLIYHALEPDPHSPTLGVGVGEKRLNLSATWRW